MMRTKTFILTLALVALLCSCGGHKNKNPYDKVGSDGLTERTENMRDNLRPYIDKGVMIGQMYGTMQGVGWQSDSLRSDIFEICNDYPAVVGYRLDGIERGGDRNVDGLRFESIRYNAINYFHRNGLILMSWAMPERTDDDDQIELWAQELARFLGSLQDTLGIKVPVVLFINPLEKGAWYASLSEDDYTDLYEKVADALGEKELTNVIYGYSEELTGMEMKAEYPDDISVINLTYFQEKNHADPVQYVNTLSKVLPQLLSDADDNHSVPGLTTGIATMQDTTFFAGRLLPLLKKNPLSYVMFGGNSGDIKDDRYYVPFPGISNSFIHDFNAMYNDKRTVFLSQLNGLYLKH